MRLIGGHGDGREHPDEPATYLNVTWMDSDNVGVDRYQRDGDRWVFLDEKWRQDAEQWHEERTAEMLRYIFLEPSSEKEKADG